MKPNTKPGIKTTEFWISILAVIYGTAITTGMIPHSDEISTAVNGIGTLLVAIGYTWARAFIKGKRQE